MEALLRSVGADLEPCTPLEREIDLRAGPELTERLRALGPAPVGAAFVSPAGDLAAGFIIHVVIRGPDEPISEQGIRRALRNGLRQVSAWEMRTLGIVPLGVGAGNLDAEESARIVVDELRLHADLSPFPREVAVAAANPYEEEAFLREVERTDPAEPVGRSSGSRDETMEEGQETAAGEGF